MSLLEFEQQFSNLKMNNRGGSEKSPHKVAMLLAVIELIQNGLIVDNRIPFDRKLKESFSLHFSQFAGSRDRDNPHLPYFHLRTSKFWHHRIKQGKADEYSELTTAASPRTIENCIEYVFLDDELFELLGYGVARELLKAALLRNLSNDDRTNLLDVGNGWDWLECEAIVQDYFNMLNLELAGIQYNKSEHRRLLKSRLKNRSDSSIEFKHQNISAVLLEFGQPYIQGYKPAFNYQIQLKHVVLTYLAGNQGELDNILEFALVDTSDQLPDVDWNNVIDMEIPEKISNILHPERKYLARKTNFTEREQNNRKLGERGEAFVVEYERFRLNQLNRPDLAKEVEWRSKEEGDGLGYDIRSFSPNPEEELFIEVKTTNSGKYQPFYITDNEVEFSRERFSQYCLYRVFDFKKQARIFKLKGAVDKYVHLNPKSFRASFA